MYMNDVRFLYALEPPPPDSVIRVMAIHKAPEMISENLTCCPKHVDEQKRAGGNQLEIQSPFYLHVVHVHRHVHMHMHVYVHVRVHIRVLTSFVAALQVNSSLTISCGLRTETLTVASVRTYRASGSQ